jgi:hypothetical protein
MYPRIFKFYGKAFSHTGTVNVTATFNGTQVHSGPVVTVDSFPPGQNTGELDVLFEYTGTTDLSGNIPLELLVTNGTLFFGTVDANYSGMELSIDRTNPSAPVVTVITAPENFWGDVNRNSIETDGKINVKINGVDQDREVINPDDIGDWNYCIPSNGTLTCDIFVDPTVTAT